MQDGTLSAKTSPTEALARAAREGDRTAFDRLFTRSAAAALLFIRLRMGPALRGDAESMDVLQDAWMEAHRDFARFEWRGEGSFSRWFCRLIENRLRAMADHAAAKKRTPDGSRESFAALLHAARTEAGPATLAARAERDERLAHALLGLEEAERQALLLRHFEGASIEEIAAALDRSETATRRLLGRAAAALGRRMGASGEAGR